MSGAWDSIYNPRSAIRSPKSIMSPLLFWTFSLLMLVFGVAVVINRNPVASALSLVVSFLGLAALFMSLDAYFIGIIQVLVYAGAVMVLFLFIIMLLDLRAEEGRREAYELRPVVVARRLRAVAPAPEVLLEAHDAAEVGVLESHALQVRLEGGEGRGREDRKSVV